MKKIEDFTQYFTSSSCVMIQSEMGHYSWGYADGDGDGDGDGEEFKGKRKKNGDFPFRVHTIS